MRSTVLLRKNVANSFTRYGDNMLDKVILTHVEEMDNVEERIKEDLDKLIDTLDVDELMNDPEKVLQTFTAYVNEYIQNKYWEVAAKNGIEFANSIRKDGDIQVPKTNDPKLNEGEID